MILILLAAAPARAQETEAPPLSAGPEMGSLLPTIEDVPELAELRNQLTDGGLYLGRRVTEGKLMRVKEKLEAYLAENSTSAPALVLLGVTERRLGLSRSAKIDLEKAVRADPGYGLAHYDLALYYHSTRDTDAAIEEYRKAVENDPSLYMAYYNLGVLLAGQGRFEEAEAEYVRAKAIRPNFVDACINLGDIYYARGRLRRAFEEYREALELAPKSAVLYNNLALVHRRIGEYDEAEKALLQAAELEPDLATAYYNLAQVRYLKDDRAGAAEALKKYLGLVKNDGPSERTELAEKMLALLEKTPGGEAAPTATEKPASTGGPTEATKTPVPQSPPEDGTPRP